MARTALGIIVLALVLWLSPGSAKGANPFTVCSSTNLSSTAADTPTDITTVFGAGLDPFTCAPFSSPGSTNIWMPSDTVFFTPPGWDVATDGDIQDGAKVGTFNSKMTFGLFDNGCSIVLPVSFDLLDATIDTNPHVTPRAEGAADRLRPYAEDNGTGIPTAATSWPSYLSDVADKVGMDLTKLIARYVGVNRTSVTGTTIVWNFLVFQPGARISDRYSIDPALGYPTVSIFQDPTSPGSAKDPISDLCAPFWSTMTLNGTVDGKTYRGTPNDRVSAFTIFANPAPDADNDGIENTLDPCPTTPNDSGWDPRGPTTQSPGDQDGDGVPDDCDPFPTVKSTHNSANGLSNADEDGDGWQNRLDNCPLAKNGLNETTIAAGDQTDTDRDGIGDACDPNPTAVDGQNLPVCLVNYVFIGAGGPDPTDPNTLLPCGACTPFTTAMAQNIRQLGCGGGFSGDVDCNGHTDAFDLLAELQDVAGVSTPDCPGQEYTGRCDQNVDPFDIVVFLRFLAGFQTEPLPILCPDPTRIP
ncbi:MAG: thrombospondin type 3 repeat-containing protein [Chloroflexota bacterium]